jgi:Uma2 family endonuclease
MTWAYDIQMTVGTLMTAEELLALPEDGCRYELVQGELQKMSPSGTRHAHVAARIIGSLIGYVERHRLGAVCASEGGFRLSRNPDTVLAPDAAFIAAARFVDTPGFFEGPPDAAFEVISPSDSYTQVEEKTLRWLRAGARVVVIVDRRTQTVRVHRTGSTVTMNDAIELDDVIAGWRLPLAELFA